MRKLLVIIIISIIAWNADAQMTTKEMLKLEKSLDWSKAEVKKYSEVLPNGIRITLPESDFSPLRDAPVINSDLSILGSEMLSCYHISEKNDYVTPLLIMEDYAVYLLDGKHSFPWEKLEFPLFIQINKTKLVCRHNIIND